MNSINKIDIKLISDNAVVPSRATEGSAGYDLRACIDMPVIIAPGETAAISSGIAVALPGSGYAALVCARSGLATKHGIALANGVGLIDSDYRGEIRVALINHSSAPYTIEPGERIAQLIIIPVAVPELVVRDELPETVRGGGGFGSTGRG